ncbi:MAG TPA: lasso peptide biosynthesis B2 protein [Bacteroidales bacterium]|nr:lasso peptide biosynthesis B2 protein [Bacteroidales bacterium]
MSLPDMTGNRSHLFFVRVLQVPLKDWFLFTEAFLLLFFWRFVTFVVPLRYYSRYLGKPQKDFSGTELPFSDEIARIGLAVRRAVKYSVIPAKCLTEAIIVKRMLARRRIPSALYLGVTHEKNNRKLKAHAWLRYGNQVITGRRGHEKFTVVSIFV